MNLEPGMSCQNLEFRIGVKERDALAYGDGADQAIIETTYGLSTASTLAVQHRGRIEVRRTAVQHLRSSEQSA